MGGWWSGSYQVSGDLAVTWKGSRFPVALPERNEIQHSEYPDREAPNAKAHFDIMGFSPKPPDPTVVPKKGPQIFRSGVAGPIRKGMELEPHAERCPGAGWHFHLDSIESPAVERISVTVPRGSANATWGVLLDEHLPWPGPPAGISQATAARVGDFTYDLTVRTISRSRWLWMVEPNGPTADWLTRFMLDIETDGGEPPDWAHIRYASEAAHDPALQADLRFELR